MPESRIAQSQPLENLGAIDLGIHHDGSTLKRNVNHGSPPVGLHQVLLGHSVAQGEPLKRPRGRNTSRPFTAVDKERAPRMAPSLIVVTISWSSRTRACRSRP